MHEFSPALFFFTSPNPPPPDFSNGPVPESSRARQQFHGVNCFVLKLTVGYDLLIIRRNARRPQIAESPRRNTKNSSSEDKKTVSFLKDLLVFFFYMYSCSSKHSKLVVNTFISLESFFNLVYRLQIRLR